ncbi:MAG: hypothetical protein JWR53_1825, partial [Glaciihabitans sp.]|nr:hypothetical protein [Glaciihabitans sp.]
MINSDYISFAAARATQAEELKAA